MNKYQVAIDIVREYIERSKQFLNPPGIVLGFTNRDESIGYLCSGFSNIDRGEKITPESLLQIGSISKSFASVAALKAQEDGLVDIHRPITHYLPWFKVQSQYDSITLHHLMSHTAGLIKGKEATLATHSEVWKLRDTEVSSPPGTYYYYSNLGFKIVGLILEKVLGSGTENILKKLVLDPIGMNNSEPAISLDVRERLITGYPAQFDDRPLPFGGYIMPGPWIFGESADGNICSTAADMTKYVRFLLNRGQGVLSEKSFSRLIQPVIKVENESQDGFYGYGLINSLVDGHTWIGHTGGTVAGFRSAILLDLDDGLGVTILANGPFDPKSMASIALKIFQAAKHGQIENISMPEPFNPTLIKNASDYSGDYHSNGEIISFIARGRQLYLSQNENPILMQHHPELGQEAFLAPHPKYAYFPFLFHRENGDIQSVAYGDQCFYHSRYLGPKGFSYPEQWNALTGHYASHNPWLSHFRIVIRNGKLIWVHSSGWELPLNAIGENLFRVGEDKSFFETIKFDMFIDGQAHQASFSGADCYRTFTL